MLLIKDFHAKYSPVAIQRIPKIEAAIHLVNSSIVPIFGNRVVVSRA